MRRMTKALTGRRGKQLGTSGLSNARKSGKGTLWRDCCRRRWSNANFLDPIPARAFPDFVFDFRLVSHRSPDYDETVRLRNRILRAPLGLTFSHQELEAEAGDFHLAGFAETSGALIACLVLTPLDGESLKMRQVAVTESYRGRGIGKALVRFAESFARERSISRLVLHARESVVPFYESLGYSIEGPPFTEVTIPHRRLTKTLDSPDVAAPSKGETPGPLGPGVESE